MTSKEPDNSEITTGLSRRQFLQAGAAGALAIGGSRWVRPNVLTSAEKISKAPKPVRGGTMTVGMITGGTAETVDPGLVIANVDILRVRQLYETLFNPSTNIKTLVPRLALSADPNKDATVWTIQLRDGVVWHDGKPFTADDLMWTIAAWGSVDNYANAIFAGIVDFKSVRKRGPLTVEIPLLTPVGQFPSLLSFDTPYVIQNGATPQQLRTHPIGTGPFKFESFQPGTQSIFTRNPHYWESGNKPYVDKLIINSTFTDENARLNALLGGEIDVSSIIPPLIAKTQQSSHQIQLLTSHSSLGYAIWMRVDKGPFTDVRVRQALKMIADRPALVEGALAGFGTVGNDLQGVGCAYYLDLPPLPYDIDKAKSLLKSAGQEGLSFSLPTSNAVPGFVEAATLYAEQAAAAGVKVSVDQIPAATYYTSASGFLTRPICLDSGYGFQSLTELFQTTFTKTAPYNETHWCSQKGGTADNALIGEAIAALEPTRAAELWREVQLQQYNGGGGISYANADYVDACANNVHGLTTTPAGNLNGGRLLDGWIG